MITSLVERLRRPRKVLRDNVWVDSDKPLNIDGPEAADTIEKLQNDFIALLSVMKEEARQRGIAEGKLAAYTDKIEGQFRRLEGKIDGYKGAKEKVASAADKIKPLYSKPQTPSSTQKFIEKGIPKVKVTTKLTEINFPARIENVMRNINAETIGDVTLLTEPDLLANPNLGRKSVSLIKKVLTANGYALSETKLIGPRIKRDKYGSFICFVKEASVAT